MTKKWKPDKHKIWFEEFFLGDLWAEEITEEEALAEIEKRK